MMKKSRAAQIATNSANQTQSRHQQRAVDRTTAFDEASRPTQVVGFDADRGKMIVQSLGNEAVAVGVPITNGGLATGRSADVDGGYVGGMPRSVVPTEEFSTSQPVPTIVFIYAVEAYATNAIELWLKINDNDAQKIFSSSNFRSLYTSGDVLLTLVNRRLKVVQIISIYSDLELKTIVFRDAEIVQQNYQILPISFDNPRAINYPDEFADYTDYLSPAVYQGKLATPQVYGEDAPMQYNEELSTQNPKNGKLQQLIPKDYLLVAYPTLITPYHPWFQSRFQLVDSATVTANPDLPARPIGRSRRIITATPDEVGIPSGYREFIPGTVDPETGSTLADLIDRRVQGSSEGFGRNALIKYPGEYTIGIVVSLAAAKGIL